MPAASIAASTVIVSQVPPAPALLPQSARITGGGSAAARASVIGDGLGAGIDQPRAALPEHGGDAARGGGGGRATGAADDQHGRSGHRAVGQREAPEHRDVDDVASIGQRLRQRVGRAHRLVVGHLAQHLRQDGHAAQCLRRRDVPRRSWRTAAVLRGVRSRRRRRADRCGSRRRSSPGRRPPARGWRGSRAQARWAPSASGRGSRAGSAPRRRCRRERHRPVQVEEQRVGGRVGTRRGAARSAGRALPAVAGAEGSASAKSGSAIAAPAARAPFEEPAERRLCAVVCGKDRGAGDRLAVRERTPRTAWAAARSCSFRGGSPPAGRAGAWARFRGRRGCAVTGGGAAGGECAVMLHRRAIDHCQSALKPHWRHYNGADPRTQRLSCGCLCAAATLPMPTPAVVRAPRASRPSFLRYAAPAPSGPQYALRVAVHRATVPHQPAAVRAPLHRLLLPQVGGSLP